MMIMLESAANFSYRREDLDVRALAYSTALIPTAPELSISTIERARRVHSYEIYDREPGLK